METNISSNFRQGWATAAKKAHDEGGDSLIAIDVFNDDITEEIEW